MFERFKRLQEKVLPQRFFFLGGEIRISQDMDNTAALDDPVRTDHFCYGKHGSHLHDGNTSLFELGRDRSTAASRRPSRGGENDRIDPFCLELLCYFTSQPAAVGQGIGQA